MTKTSKAKRVIQKLFKKKRLKAETNPAEAPVVDAPKGKVRSILLTQPKPETDRHPYFDLSYRFNIEFIFKPFLHLEPLPAKEFRKWKINPLDYQAIVFTSRNTIDHFFKLLDEMRLKVSEETKYYCMTEAIALYLQKYIMFRKRKVFFGDGTIKGLYDEIFRHHEDVKYLMPCADNNKHELAEMMKKIKYVFTEAVILKTVPVALTESDLSYDLIVFFSPASVHSFIQNFPEFKQNKIRLATFGPLTTQTALDANLKLDIIAPTLESPSMAMALEKYLLLCNKK